MRQIPLLLLASFALSQSACWANLVVNPSFETGFGSWTATGNLAVITGQGETDGSSAAAFSFLNLPSTGVLSQSFATTLGQAYSLTFDFGKFGVLSPDTARLEVDVFDGVGVAGTNLFNQTLEDTTPGNGGTSTDSPDVYSSFQFNFTAQSSMATLRFTDNSDAQTVGGFDAMLDNVSVAVPEPTAFLCMLVVGLGCIARSRWSALVWRQLLLQQGD